MDTPSPTKPPVFVARVIPDEGLELLAQHCTVDLWRDQLPPRRDALMERVQGVHGILALLTDRIDGAVMDAASPHLQVISNLAVGYDNIDVPAATERGIMVGNTPDVLTETSADFTWALLMAAARRIVEGDHYSRTGQWQTWEPKLLLGQDITGATLGIIGFGRIGKAVAKRASGFAMRVLYHSSTPRDDPDAARLGAQRVDLDTLLGEADFVSIHTPLTPQTRALIDAKALARMKRTAILINTARGPVVDSAALYDALAHGIIAYAALDVTDPEPIPMDSPLLLLPNIIIAPHIASASVKTRGQMARIAALNLIAGVNREPLPHCVNPEASRYASL